MSHDTVSPVTPVSAAGMVRSAAARRAAPLALVFLASACVMVIEINAGRLVARHVGTSLHTWTSIIGVVLAGLSLGNFWGGRIADRLAADRIRGVLSFQFLVSSLLCLSIVWTHRVVFELPGAADMSWPVRIVTGVTLALLLPATALGTISPVVARWALESRVSMGRTLGGLYGWGSLGAIAGTLVTGFVLIAHVGTTAVICIVALALAIAAAALRIDRVTYGWLGVTTLLLASAVAPWEWSRSLGWLLGVRPAGSAVLVTESAYQAITVERAADGVLTLRLDDLAHAHVRPDDPTYLGYTYLRIWAGVVQSLLEPAQAAAPRSLLLGGGAYNFPRYLAARYPGGSAVVAELDPAVTETARAVLGLSDGPPLRVVHQDARFAARALRASGAQFDFVFVDAFRNLDVPAHLTTLEFQRELRTLLSERGVVMANVIDELGSARFLGAYVNTLGAVFEHLYVFGTEPPGSRLRDTFVVVGSRAPLDTAAVRAAAVALGAPGIHLLDAAELERLHRQSRGLVLTDEHAPVENLLAQWRSR